MVLTCLFLLFSNFAVVHPNTIGDPETFWFDIPKITALSQQKWGEFDSKRIHRQRERIAKGLAILFLSQFCGQPIARSFGFPSVCLAILFLSQLIGRRAFLVRKLR